MQASLPMSNVRQVEMALTACGYRVVSALPWLAVPLPEGSVLSLQFGDLIALGSDGRPELGLRAAIQINGDLKQSAGMARWTLEKRYPAGSESGADLLMKIDLYLGLKEDLRLPDDLRATHASIQSAQTYRYLLELVADLRQSLRGIAVSSTRKGWLGPALRLEMRSLSDLTLGRSGALRPCPQTVSRDYMRLALAACDGLATCILPELRHVTRELSSQRGSYISSMLAKLSPSQKGSADSLPFVETATMAAESEAIP